MTRKYNKKICLTISRIIFSLCYDYEHYECNFVFLAFGNKSFSSTNIFLSYIWGYYPVFQIVTVFFLFKRHFKKKYNLVKKLIYDAFPVCEWVNLNFPKGDMKNIFSNKNKCYDFYGAFFLQMFLKFKYILFQIVNVIKIIIAVE